VDPVRAAVTGAEDPVAAALSTFLATSLARCGIPVWFDVCTHLGRRRAGGGDYVRVAGRTHIPLCVCVQRRERSTGCFVSFLLVHPLLRRRVRRELLRLHRGRYRYGLSTPRPNEL
jgi:hypothetical protein